jgi:hypothetical protein
MKYTLLTRTSEENLALSKKLNTKGILTYSFPLIELRAITIDWSKLSRYSHIIITSKFAAKIATANIAHNVKVLVVGQESANILKQNKHIIIQKIFLSVRKLISHLAQMNNLIPCAYLSGSVIKQDMPKFIERHIIYDTFYTAEISLELKQKIIDMEIGSIMLYSENSAKKFIELCKQNGLLLYISRITAITLSKNIKYVLQNYIEYVDYCSRPCNHLMIELLYKLHAKIC